MEMIREWFGISLTSCYGEGQKVDDEKIYSIVLLVDVAHYLEALEKTRLIWDEKFDIMGKIFA